MLWMKYWLNVSESSLDAIFFILKEQDFYSVILRLYLLNNNNITGKHRRFKYYGVKYEVYFFETVFKKINDFERYFTIKCFRKRKSK